MRTVPLKHLCGSQKTFKIINIYGPAEATMWVSTAHEIVETEETVYENNNR